MTREKSVTLPLKINPTATLNVCQILNWKEDHHVSVSIA